jgi:aminopeptidase N
MTAAPVNAAPGSPGSGDPYFPTSGNGGYDVQSYSISLDIDPTSGVIAGNEVVTALATQDLSAFYLDLSGLTVSAVTVDGAGAEFRREGKELRVDLPAAVKAGARFSVAIEYTGVPAPTLGKLYTMGWQKIGDTIFTLDEPQGAATWFPVNDVPSDKASYTFRLTVPPAYTATANGVLTGTETTGTKRTFIWKMDQPMASYLAQVDVGRFTLETSTSAGGVPLRSYFAAGLESTAHKAFARMGEVLDYYASLFGPYPFPVYGVVVPDAVTGAAMENQALSLYGRDVLEKNMGDPTTGAIYLSHELAHQWFGDSVTIERWDDIWLAEGFATYASWLWLEHDLGPRALQGQVAESETMLAKSIESPPGTPGPDHLFGTSVYRRGALTLHALRLTVGDEAFFAILRSWAEEHKYGAGDTADFIALAKQKAPQIPAARLDTLFQEWLYGKTLPALPAAAAGGS